MYKRQRPARTRCTEGLASALDGAARYLTLHISIVPLELKEGCDPNAAKVSLMHCYEAWKVEDLEEDSE